MAETHIVKQGECLASIAKAYDFLDYHIIYDHPRNAAFKRKHPNPNIVFPGDSLYIPDKDQKIEDRPTGGVHYFQLKRQRVMLRLVLKDGGGTPFAAKAYELNVDGQVFNGSTDGAGMLQQFIPADASNGELKVWIGKNKDAGCLTWNLAIGHLDPSDAISGVQARLNNLGFYCGAVDGILGPRTKFALKCFQAHAGLTQTGDHDSSTCALLGSTHDNLG
jgi:hypothetical protein